MQVGENSSPGAELTHPKYRADIDGLRAIAVLSVMAFHAFPLRVQGGFIGVDIFFVISGFLISTIIFKSLSCGEFSFLEFYSRRVRRIFPALATVLVATLVGGWFVLYPDEYRQLGKHVFGGAGFISNFVLLRESGYFDAAADTKPLLHLWSLGIEEQFYIVFPLFVWLLWRMRLNVLTFVVVAGLVSFLLNLRGVHHDVVRTFYMPHTRVWELLIGSVLAWMMLDASGRMAQVEATAGRWCRKLLYQPQAEVTAESALADVKAWLGVLLVVVGLWKITKGVHFPGGWALLPTLGAALLIWAGPQAYVNRRWLSARVLVWIGKISYPLYLWHWVLLTYLRIEASGTPPAWVRAGALGLAVLLSWLTYRLIEKPLRFGSGGRRKTIALAIAMGAIAVLGLAVHRTNMLANMESARGAQFKVITELTTLYQKELDRWQDQKRTVRCFILPTPDIPGTDFFKRNGCLTPASDKPSVLLMGDSHSASLSQGLRGWAKSMNINFQQVSGFYGPLLFCFNQDGQESEKCESDYHREVMATIRDAKPDVLVFDLYWSQSSTVKRFPNMERFTAHVMDRVARLAASIGVKKVIIIGQVPCWESDLPHSLIRNFVRRGKEIPERTYTGVMKDSLDMDDVMRNLIYPPGYRYFSLKNILCNDEGCLTRVGSNLSTDLVVWDYGHLTEAGARYVVNNGLGEVILQTLQRH